MRTFTDNANRTWKIELTLDAFERVFQQTADDTHESIDLLDPLEGKPPLITRLDLNLRLLFRVLRALLAPQIEAAKIEAADFAQAIGGKASADARAAFMEEYAFFFREDGREHFAKAIETQTSLTRKNIAAAAMRIEARARRIDIEKVLDQAEAKADAADPDGPGSVFGNSPELRASTLDLSPSGNSSGPPTPETVPSGSEPPPLSATSPTA